MKTNKYLEELKSISDLSLKRPSIDEEYKRMRLLQDMLNIHGGKVPYPLWRVRLNMFLYKLFGRLR